MTIGVDFWEAKHKTDDKLWLTGSGIRDHFKYHGIDASAFEGKTVLEIGVGLGIASRKMSRMCSKLYCSDISQEALDRVKSFSSTSLSADLASVPPVDFAICHLVFQHCTDDEVARIIQDVNLTENGVFSFQFAYLGDSPPSQEVQSCVENGTHFFRSVETVEQIVSASNKQIVSMSEPLHFLPENVYWKIARVANK